MVDSLSFEYSNTSDSLILSNIVNFQLIIIDPNVNKDIYLMDSSCLICKNKFILARHKYRCKFCWHGVCAKCSKQKTYHPTYECAKRICDECFKAYIYKLSNASIENEVSRSKKVIEELHYYIKNTTETVCRDSKTTGILKEKYEAIDNEIKNIEMRSKLRESADEKTKENSRISKEIGIIEIENNFRRRKTRMAEDRVIWVRKLDDKLGEAIKDRILLSKEARMLESKLKNYNEKRKQIDGMHDTLFKLREHKKSLYRQLAPLNKEAHNESCLECIIQ
ncbi:unnamed protein product [Blepharisma stoltei]|uniref:FYVE-type domain-containing protein n=1 Tax=Blepharisma stoltei TaxID=1481888 RepID=A0AAU9JE90_9CILI|nr:unnamed protein product [Blepharisma stoltei]